MRIQRLTIRNFRVLQDVTLDDLTPLTVLCGANGSGKSTLLDALSLLGDMFTNGLGPAWSRSRPGMSPYTDHGPLAFELRMTDVPEHYGRVISYSVEVIRAKTRFVVHESLFWDDAKGTEHILEFDAGRGWYRNEQTGESVRQELADDDALAVAVLAQLQVHPVLRSLRDFFRGWRVFRPTPDSIREGQPLVRGSRLSRSGDNLFSVLLDLKTSGDTELDYLEIIRATRRFIPLLNDVLPYERPDGTIGLQLWDRPSSTTVLAPHISDGTLQLLAYLTLLLDPRRDPVIAVDEPENQLHHKLLHPLAEEFRRAAGRRQVFVATHSPHFVDAIRPDELWALSRQASGYASVERASDEPKVMAMMEAGASLGDLWSEGYLARADPQGVR